MRLPTDARLRRGRSRRGASMAMVMCIVAITMSMCYAIARSSTMVALISTHESADARSARAAQSAIALAMTRLRAEPNWAGTLEGQFGDGERYQVTVRCADEDTRVLIASGVAYDSSQRVLADRRLQVTLRKQPLDGQPDSAIVAAGSGDLGELTPTVDLEDTVRVEGRIKAHGHVRGIAGEWFDRLERRHGRKAKRAVHIDTDRYRRYTIGCTEYHAERLDPHGRRDPGGRLHIENVVLGPSSANPLGVYYYEGNVLLGDGVFVQGTVAVDGSVWIDGSGIRVLSVGLPQDGRELRFPAILAARDVHFGDEADCVRIRGVLAAAGTVSRERQDLAPKPCPHDHGEKRGRDEDESGDRDSDESHRSNDRREDQRREDERNDRDDRSARDERDDRERDDRGGEGAEHSDASSDRNTPRSHSAPRAPEPVPMPPPESLTRPAINPSGLNHMAECHGPAIQIDGAILARRVELKHCMGRPFEISFKRTVADVSNAPGFHDWKVNEWRDGRGAASGSARNMDTND